jgi:hypothetical protein
VIRRGGAIDQLQSLTVHATACAQYLSLAFTSSGLSPAAIQSRTHEFIIHPEQMKARLSLFAVKKRGLEWFLKDSYELKAMIFVKLLRS